VLEATAAMMINETAWNEKLTKSKEMFTQRF
jgi:hypothetical protein